jgi:hypothetical protein
MTPRLEEPHFALPQTALALQTKVGAVEDLALHVPLDERLIPVFEALLLQMQGVGHDCRKITLVDRDAAKLEIVMEHDALAFNILDKRVTTFGLTRIPFRVTPDVHDIYFILCALAHYHWHLNRTQANNLISTKVQIEFTTLVKSKTEYDEETGQPNIGPDGPNLYRDGLIDLVVDEEAIYGIKITNNTLWDLFTGVFFFDNGDFSISK